VTDPDEGGAPTTEGEPVRLGLGDPAFAANAFAHYAALRTACPVHRAVVTGGDGAPVAGLLGQPFWAVSGYAEAAALLLDDRCGVDPRTVLSPEALASIPGTDDEFRPIFNNLLSLDPPAHTRLRRLVQPRFTARAIESMRPRIQRIADDLLDAAEREAADRGETAPDRTMDLIPAFALPLPLAVIFELLGIPGADRDKVGAWSDALLGIEGLATDEALRARLRPFISYLRDLAAAKRAAPGDDLITAMVQAEEDGDTLDEDELLSMVFILVVAGHVTTVNLIANAVFALLTHPAELAKLTADPASVNGAVEETLRYWGPVEVASERYPREGADLGGVAIGRGEPAVTLLAAANRDPARFADPNRFDIGRPDAGRHLAFGKGVHACLGAPLARAEGQIAVATVFRRYPRLRLAVSAEEIVWKPGFLRALAALPVRF
jgi:cytochrome P450